MLTEKFQNHFCYLSLIEAKLYPSPFIIILGSKVVKHLCMVEGDHLSQCGWLCIVFR